MIHDWKEQGLPPLPISVNVSRADIYNADLTDILTGLLQKHGLPPSCLRLEITESAYTENPWQIIDTVSRLREIGCECAQGYYLAKTMSVKEFELLMKENNVGWR